MFNTVPTPRPPIPSLPPLRPGPAAGRDVFWYTREKQGHDALEDERVAVKQREEQLMMEALGLKPKAPPLPPAPSAVDKNELQALLRRGEHVAAPGADEHGLGFGQ